MTLIAFLAAVLTLLATPGPTNTLMALAGAEGGVRRVARLLQAELAGYLTTILPLVWLGGALHALGPTPALALKAAGALWGMLLAVRLWRRLPAEAVGPHVTARQVYVTTMLNPKALVFGLVLLPAPTEADFPVRLALFCLMVAAVALAWGCGGAATQVRGGSPGRLVALRRLASVWLGLVSLTLVASVVWR